MQNNYYLIYNDINYKNITNGILLLLLLETEINYLKYDIN